MDKERFNEQEIDLIDIFLRLLEQWRGLVAAGICCAIVFSVAMYIRSAATAATAQSQTTEEKQVASDDYSAIGTALTQYTDYIVLKESYDRSLLKKVDYSDCVTVTSLYRFESVNPGENLYTMVQLYINIVNDTDFNTTLAKSLYKDVDIDSLRDIMSVSAVADSTKKDPTYGILTVSVTLPEGTDTNEWNKTLTGAVDIYRNKISGAAGPNTIEPVTSIAKRGNDVELIKARNTRVAAIVTAKALYDKTFTALTKERQAVVEKIIADKAGEYNTESYLNALEAKLAETEQKPEAEVSATGDGAKTGFDVKYVVLGFIIGVFIYACAYMAYFIFVRRVREESDLENVSGVRNFGGIYEYQYKGWLQTFLHDKKVYGFRTRKGKDITSLTDDLEAGLKFTDCDNVTILSVGKPTDRTENITGQQIRDLERRNIKASVLNISEGVDKVRDSEYTGIGNVIILLLGNETKWTDLSTVYFKLKEYNVNIIGSEYIEA